MYELKVKKPELSYCVNIEYHGEEQLKALEEVYGPLSKLTCRLDEGYFGITEPYEEPGVWSDYYMDGDTIIPFDEVFKEVEESVVPGVMLPLTAQRVYELGRSARAELKAQRQSVQRDALKELVDKLIIPRTNNGYTSVSFRWGTSPEWAKALFQSFSKKEFAEEMESDGFVVEFEDAYTPEGREHERMVRVSWDKGE